MNIMAKGFTKSSFMELWKSELLPSIQDLIKSENKEIHDKISDLKVRFTKVEESQQLLSAKYDELLHSLQSTKKNIADQEQQLSNAASEIGKIRDSNYQHAMDIDEMQQYMRRDCLEITGIPTAYRSKRPQVKTSPGQNVPKSKRPQVKTSQGQNRHKGKIITRQKYTK